MVKLNFSILLRSSANNTVDYIIALYFKLNIVIRFYDIKKRNIIGLKVPSARNNAELDALHSNGGYLVSWLYHGRTLDITHTLPWNRSYPFL